ncbi:hypothetical protein M422DRAFT_268901 [Sphaerobolus stellatus SS14]|uniref:DUF6534 domain-containing protein n=1 Tax=Sphaerobolus stellatus (strain SS14) TaxID=990650 RepID=A0A0C9U5V4_SPHS4|nr:hypothetical protein M422DRAFT_268901 [Sphaerobolus stellatus SS14]
MSGVDLGHTFGSAAVSSFLGAGLFGFTFLQTYTYFIHKSTYDPLAMKLGVFLVWVLDCMQAVFLVWAVYWYLVQNYFNPLALSAIHWPLPLSWMMSTTHDAYDDRVSGALSLKRELRESTTDVNLSVSDYNHHQLLCTANLEANKNALLTGIIGLTTLGQFASTLTTFIRISMQLDIISAELTRQIGPTLTSQQVFASISNNLISGSLIYYNYKKTGSFLGKDGWIEGVLTILVDYATLAGFLQLVYLAMCLAYPKTFLSLPYQVATGKLLVNALLAQLNARDMNKISDDLKKPTLQLTTIPRFGPINLSMGPRASVARSAAEEDSPHSTTSKQFIDLELERKAPKN